ncbi:MAG TPA: hypothetical protein DCE41_35555 [Cytophagales bacterium]|nr:hypothetical protein [Cytophagales bacterium]HAA23179.1 hypothetical protein [Cytophagales bacterium]HAP59084.1 hypothetical protein [Cytophagales bacterium]
MRLLILLLLFFCFSSALTAQENPRLIHVFVALADNEYQGIVPVPGSLGDGDRPSRNLYWGAAYGIRTYFGRAEEWELVADLETSNSKILDRVLFKHRKSGTYLLADAYEGKYIRGCTEDFLKACNGQNPERIVAPLVHLEFGGGADLLVYVGHNGLMDFEVSVEYEPVPSGHGREAILLGCYTQFYFEGEMEAAQAHPLLWTTHLMAPEAYSLHAAMEGWIRGESDEAIDERAAQAYHQYQNCGIRGARNLFATGYAK